ncbi:uncharacterized protein B0H18DRAFT_34357 [Fomitopsis serialis]|uniref:uncharacterized protein n=1 Tax=Fomitopsis serialis TaxID=139415 RepID=UPI0020073919|nr:uncharacterized protein B0H18DRAFT_34357 [Neoantrodia serialis]KAH9917554.1 hypothetical protein B0H18DRAFT_34357 [Neoantrodia serialis]
MTLPALAHLHAKGARVEMEQSYSRRRSPVVCSHNRQLLFSPRAYLPDAHCMGSGQLQVSRSATHDHPHAGERPTSRQSEKLFGLADYRRIGMHASHSEAEPIVAELIQFIHPRLAASAKPSPSSVMNSLQSAISGQLEVSPATHNSAQRSRTVQRGLCIASPRSHHILESLFIKGVANQRSQKGTSRPLDALLALTLQRSPSSPRVGMSA